MYILYMMNTWPDLITLYHYSYKKLHYIWEALTTGMLQTRGLNMCACYFYCFSHFNLHPMYKWYLKQESPCRTIKRAYIGRLTKRNTITQSSHHFLTTGYPGVYCRSDSLLLCKCHHDNRPGNLGRQMFGPSASLAAVFRLVLWCL